MGQAHYPLADGYDGEHLVDEVSGALDHAPATARRAEASSFARKGNEAFEAAVATADSRKPIGQDAALEEAAQLALDETWQTGAVAAAGGVFDETCRTRAVERGEGGGRHGGEVAAATCMVRDGGPSSWAQVLNQHRP